jgi:hypothetical protein
MGSTQTNLQSIGSVVVSILTAIGSITVLEATGIVVGIICSVVATSTVLIRNITQTKQSNLEIKKLENEINEQERNSK